MSTAYRLLRELGARAQHSYAAVRESDLVVVQRFVKASATGSSGISSSSARATTLEAEPLALLLRDARCLAKNWHPNVARVKHVDLVSGELTIASELIEGATLEDLRAAAQREREAGGEDLLTLPIVARVLVDVLAGLAALHGLRDGMNAPLGAIHGEVCPANIVVGKDGVARIVNVLRPRPVRVGAGSEAVAYAAPETLDTDGTDDPRADVYSVGVVLWEALAGRRLRDDTSAARILARQREEELAAPQLHPTNPFARLAAVAMRALAFDANARFKTAAEMAAEIRKIAGTRLASGAAVAACIADLAGDSIRMRRSELDPSLSGTRKAVEVVAVVDEVEVVEEVEEVEPIDHDMQPRAVSGAVMRAASPISDPRPFPPFDAYAPAEVVPNAHALPPPPLRMPPSAIETFVIDRPAPTRRRILAAPIVGIVVAIVLATALFVARGLERRAAARAVAPRPTAPTFVTPTASTTSDAPQAVATAPTTGTATSIATATATAGSTTTTTPTSVAKPAPLAPRPAPLAKKKSIYEP